MVEEAKRSRFVGETRQATINHLRAIYRSIANEGGVRWVSIEGPAGIGKTRLIQELYERIAVDQIDPPYWPRELNLSNEAGVDANRKQINPGVFSHIPKSQPDFMWWGINCSSRHGVEAVALVQDLALLDIHADRYHDRWRLIESRDIGHPIAELGNEVAQQFAEQAVEDLIGTAVPFFGILAWLGKRTYAGISGKAARRRRLLDNETVIPDYTDVVDQVAAMLDRTARPGMPLILVIEDVHHADTALIDLLSRLVSKPTSTAILILSTGQSGHIERNDRLNDLLQNWNVDRVDRLSPGAAVPPGFPTGALDELSIADRSEVVTSHFDHLSGDVATTIAQRFENLLALELYCRLGPVRRSILAGDLPTQETLARVPRTVQALYDETWRTLPESIKHAYTLASLTIPSQHNILSPDNSWNYKLAVAAALSAKHDSISPKIAVGISKDTVAYGWCRPSGVDFRKFSEDDFRDLALGDDSVISEIERSRYLGELLGEAERYYRTFDDSTASAIDYYSWLLVALQQDAASPLSESTVDAVLHLLGTLKASTRNIPRRLELAAWILPKIDFVSRQGIAIRGNRADAFHRAGDLERAVDEYSKLYADGVEYFGLLDRDTLITQNNLGTALEDAGYFEQAITLHLESLSRRNIVFGEYSREALASHVNLGSVYKSAGQTNRAVAQYRIVLDIQERLNDSDGDLLLNQVGLVSALVQAGQFSEVVDRVEILLTQNTLELASSERFLPPLLGALVSAHRELRNFDLALSYAEEALRFAIEHSGPNSPLAIEALVNLASLRSDLGFTSDALSLLRVAEERSREVFGTYGLFTINVTKLISRALLRLGAASEALSICNRALDDAPTRYEPNHPTVLELHLIRGQILLLMQDFDSARAQALGVLEVSAERKGDSIFLVNSAQQLLAEVARDSGDVDQAIRLFSQMVESSEKHEEPDERWIMHLNNSLASCFSLAGYFSEAAALFDVVLAHNEQVFGIDHHNTVAVRLNLARTLRDGGRVLEAVSRLEDLVSNARPGLDPLDPLVHLTLSAYGATLIRSGRMEDGLMALRTSADEAYNQFGEDHIYSLSLQGELASGLIETSHFSEAARLLSSLRGPAVRKLGDSNPEVMTFEHNLLIAKLSLGQLTGVVDDARALVARRVSVLGAGHQNTLLTMDVLAGALRMTGNPKDAATVYSAAAQNAATAFGNDNVRTISIKTNLAGCLNELGHHVDSVRILRQVCEDAYMALDQNAREYVHAVTELAEIYHAQKMFAELAAHLERYLIDLCAFGAVVRSAQIPTLQLEVARLRVNSGATRQTIFDLLAYSVRVD